MQNCKIYIKKNQRRNIRTGLSLRRMESANTAHLPDEQNCPVSVVSSESGVLSVFRRTNDTAGVQTDANIRILNFGNNCSTVNNQPIVENSMKTNNKQCEAYVNQANATEVTNVTEVRKNQSKLTEANSIQTNTREDDRNSTCEAKQQTILNEAKRNQDITMEGKRNQDNTTEAKRDQGTPIEVKGTKVNTTKYKYRNLAGKRLPEDYSAETTSYTAFDDTDYLEVLEEGISTQYRPSLGDCNARNSITNAKPEDEHSSTATPVLLDNTNCKSDEISVTKFNNSNSKERGFRLETLKQQQYFNRGNHQKESEPARFREEISTSKRDNKTETSNSNTEGSIERDVILVNDNKCDIIPESSEKHSLQTQTISKSPGCNISNSDASPQESSNIFDRLKASFFPDKQNEDIGGMIGGKCCNDSEIVSKKSNLKKKNAKTK